MKFQKWLSRQHKDFYVQLRKEKDLVSRAAFKISQMDGKFKFFRTLEQTILDLGAAPGGWTQVCANMNNNHKVLAMDLLPLDDRVQSLPNVKFVQQDLRQHGVVMKVLDDYLKSVEKPHFDVVMSDMLGNTSGSPVADAAMSARLVHRAAYIASLRLRPPVKLNLPRGQVDSKKLREMKKGARGGVFIAKAYESPDVQYIFQNILKRAFQNVVTYKPRASRQESKEFYYICHSPTGREIEPPYY